MKANELNLGQFLSQSDTQFVIPVYQRNYDWSQIQCKQLLDDILAVGSDDQSHAHFIGSIVYVHDDVYSSAGIRELSIIDGQQRLTTVTLIYITIYSLAKYLDNTKLKSRIHKKYLINEFAEEEEKLKLRPTENNDRALKYLLRANEDEEFTDFSRLVDNYNYFKNRISEENYEVVLKGLEKLLFVEISLDRERDDPQRIFESLNSTGLELSQADLIRNYILMGLKRKSQQKIYENYWEVIEDLAREESTNKSRVSDFIRDYLTLVGKKIPNKNKVYLEYKLRFPIKTLEVLEENLGQIKKLVKYYNKLINPERESDKEIRYQLEYIQRLEINVAYPFIMKVYEDHSSHIISKETFIGILELIQSFTWRRFIVGLPTNALNKIFMRLYEDVKHEKYLESIEKALLEKKGSQRFPRDKEVVNILREKDIYGTKAKNRVYFLERLENYKNKEFVNISDNPNITIEHIFPQKPSLKWEAELGKDECQNIKENYLNTISNLTLSGNNGALGNCTFAEKKHMNKEGGEQGYNFSRLWLNRFLQKVDKWTITELEERFELIKGRFLEIWQIPTHQFDTSINFEEVNIFDAEDPTGKKLEYAIFFNQKFEYSEFSKLYTKVLASLFESDPNNFFTSDLAETLQITKDKNALRSAKSLNETYFFEAHLDNKTKFARLKRVLTVLGMEDELIIRYKSD